MSLLDNMVVDMYREKLLNYSYCPSSYCDDYGEIYVENAIEYIKKYGDIITQLFDTECDKDGNTALHLAIIRSERELYTHLINKGANVNVCNFKGETPLHIASTNSDDNSVESLLNAGANVNLCNNDGFTLLHIASSSGDDDIVKLPIKGRC